MTKAMSTAHKIVSGPERHKIYGAVYLMLLNKDQILLSRRFNTGWQDGKYSLVAGHVDGDESFATALCREAKEEAGIEIAPRDVEFAQAVHRRDSSDAREYVDIYFAVTAWTGRIKNKEPEKCDELAWYSLDDLPENMVPAVRTVLVNYRKGVHYTELGW